jgi:hypothetical protein
MRIQEYNTETHEVIERDATTEEIAQAELDAAEMAAFQAANQAKAAAKASLLERLGVTADEAALLLG